MSPSLETVMFVFGLVVLGYGSGAAGYLRTETGDALSQFVVRIALPLLLFRTTSVSSFQAASPWRVWTVYFSAAVLTWAAGHLVTTRFFGRDSQTGVVGGVSSAFSNIVLLGIPFILGVFGQPGFEILSLIISVHLPTMMIASIVMFHLFGAGDRPRARLPALAAIFLRRVLGNPLIAAILAGTLWRVAGPPLPGLANRLIDALANVAGPMALFAMGLDLRRFGISGNVAAALALTALKLVLMPALVLAAALLIGLPPLPAKVAVITAALPAGVNSYLIAAQLGVGQSLASSQIAIATLCSVASTALWLAVIQSIYA